MRRRWLAFVLVLLCCLCMMTTPAGVQAQEEDAAAALLHTMGVMNGVGQTADGTPDFALESTLTRAEGITLLVRLLGKESIAKAGIWTTPFTDVPAWAQPYVGYAYEHGLTNGTSAITFGSEDNMEADAYTTLLSRALGYTSENYFASALEQYQNKGTFTRGDVARLSVDALDATPNAGYLSLREQMAQTEAVYSDVTIGVIMFGPFPALTACYNGILEGLAHTGYVVGENNVVVQYADMSGDYDEGYRIAEEMVASDCDLIFAIATPAAQVVQSTAVPAGIPVLFTAVTYPVMAGLVSSMEAPQSGLSGTVDACDWAAYGKMLHDFMPAATKIGVVYSAGESGTNTDVTALRDAAAEYGLDLETATIANTEDIPDAVADLAGRGVEALVLIPDKFVSSELSSYQKCADAQKIPVFGTLETDVAQGCLAALTQDYTRLGIRAGEMGAQVLRGQSDIMTLPVETGAGSGVICSIERCVAFGVEIPAAAGIEQVSVPEPPALMLNHSDITMVIGEQCQLQASGVVRTPVWSTSDPTVATVSADGTVTAVGVGATMVTCTEGDNTADCIVRCVSAYPY